VSNEVTREDIENEARALNKLRSRNRQVNILKVFRHYWMESSQGQVYMIDMELGEGTLLDYIQKQYSGATVTKSSKMQFHVKDIWDIMQQISAGLAEIHKRGIIHRDLKPANSIARSILLVICAVIRTRPDDPTGNRIWKVADFGITTAGTSKNLIATNNQRGTLHYLAPEIILCEPGVPSYTNKVDIWSLGAILYELCTGRKAFAQVINKSYEGTSFLIM
jgi:serine/threonine protein kinase